MSKQTFRGIGFFGLLTIVFITLKLCGVIEWSWLWVLGPLWIPTATILFFILTVLVGAYTIAEVADYLASRKRGKK